MTIAAPFLYVAGGIFLGMVFTGFSRHHFFGWLTICLGAACIALAATNTTLTIPRPIIHYPVHPTPTVSVTNGHQAGNSNP